MESVNVTIRMNKELKLEAEELFKQLGMSLNTAFNIFARQAVREQGIPFKICKNEPMQLVNRKYLSQLADEEINTHLDAYKELAK